MKTLLVTAVLVNLHSGLVVLSKDQAASRRHALKPVSEKKGLYEIVEPIQFKHGETLQYDGEVNKSLFESFEEVEPEKPFDAKGKSSEGDNKPQEKTQEATKAQS